MKSRIPHSKPKQPAQAPTEYPVPEASPPGASTVLDAFVRLGAPEIAPEHFDRLYHGPLGDALLFLSIHMKGRADVALARQQIHKLREMRAKSGIKHPNDVTRSAADKAAAALLNSKKTMERYKKELNDKQVALIAPQAELEELEARLKEKRRVQILLDALEQKEMLRIRRFGEMKVLIETQRKSITRFVGPPEPTRSPATTSLQKPRLSYTRDTLASLHAHHVRLSRLLREHPSPISSLESQLRSLIDGYPHPDPDKLCQNIISSAQGRARHKVSYRSPYPGLASTPKQALDAKLESIKKEELLLQHLSAKSLALLGLVEQSIQSISVFLSQTSGLLQSSMDEEGLQVRGFVELLRHQIVGNSERQHEDGEFLRQAIVACGMRGNMTSGAVVDRVASLLYRCYQQESFLAHVRIPPVIPSDDQILIRDHHATMDDAREKAMKLLSRKVKKAEIGQSIAQDIETLVKETRIVIGGSKEV